ncbi:arsenical-resistance protein [Chloropicon primus]|uniref:Arsenical-resistance protein n=2 Tax=Chloropicon primus TaxID=1764295 RepID=A0A5B8MR41_9CHLO|nr:arsenical-resistance protein [Chloropicon primus]UPR01080.1 arsenical-resistance protein [Chloropicon primus]|eukprot:QDZ21860.1 arsenical-resistance protein [Chloropicon primus]
MATTMATTTTAARSLRGLWGAARTEPRRGGVGGSGTLPPSATRQAVALRARGPLPARRIVSARTAANGSSSSSYNDEESSSDASDAGLKVQGGNFVLLRDQDKELPWVEKLLTVWILLACAIGTALSQFPAVRQGLARTSVGTTNIPIAIGLVLMMYPPLAKVHYDWIPKLLVQVRPMVLSVVQNWILGPLLMFFLAFAFLKDYPEYLQGVILVGCARCIAMVIVWNEFAAGDSELCATLVALNSILTILLYAPFAYGLINKLLPALGVPTAEISLGFSSVLQSVAIYLGIPFALGVLSWLVLRRAKGEEWYYGKFVKRISPITLTALLLTIVFMFALEGHTLIQRPVEILLCAAPMLIYFAVMFLGSFFMAYFLECDYPTCATISFTAASNNFELALAVAVSVFGFGSKGALATIAGPLTEIPIMLALVHLSKTFKRVCFKNGKSWSWARKT